MAYARVHADWRDSPDTTTPITAVALEQIEAGIEAAAATADAAVPASELGAASGVATLNSSGKLTTGQVPDLSSQYEVAGAAATALAGHVAAVDPHPQYLTAAEGDARYSSGKPWQFRVEDYGAVGDGKPVYDAAMTSGSAVFTSATAGFTSGDVGKRVLVNKAGAVPDRNHSGCLFSTIVSITNSTTAVLADQAVRTVSNQAAMYGTDDTAAVQAAMFALHAYSGFVTSPHYAELLFDCKVYVLATAPTPGGESGHPTYGNAQIPLPVVTDGTQPKRTVVIRGVQSDNSVLAYWHQDKPQITGPCLFSMIEVSASDPTYGNVSVIGGPTDTSPFNFQRNNVLVVVDAIQVTCPVNPGQIALDFWQMCQFAVKTATCDVFAGVTSDPNIQFGGESARNTRGQGLRIPQTGLNDRCDIGSITIEGYYYGMSIDQHLAAQRVCILYSVAALYYSGTGGNQLTHGCWIGYASTEICDYCLFIAGGSGSIFSINIGMLDNEGEVVQHVYDPDNATTGQVLLLPSGSQTLPVPAKVQGAGNLEVLSMAQPRGAVTAPSVPATTVALQNPFWRHAAVSVAGGTVSAIRVDGQTTGLTSGTVIVPSGKTITLTYTSAPTWVWTLL